MSPSQAKDFGQRETIFRLRDWGISRQRYWGTLSRSCTALKRIVSVPDEDLPVLLPENVHSPAKWLPLAATGICEHHLPKCGGPARRETDTMEPLSIPPGISIATAIAKRPSSLRPRESRVLVSHRSVHRGITMPSCTALFALLVQGHA